MTSRDLHDRMWQEACEMLARADRLHREFFRPGRAAQPAWEPPIDVLETDDALWIVLALPGVRADAVTVESHGRLLTVSGTRGLPRELARARIHRLEIPHGRFERTIELPARPLELAAREVVDGCLVLGLRKLDR